jgi:hypothetical protein
MWMHSKQSNISNNGYEQTSKLQSTLPRKRKIAPNKQSEKQVRFFSTKTFGSFSQDEITNT